MKRALHSNPSLRRKAGFTILEVVLAMGILVIGMTVLLSLFTFGAALSRSAEMRTSAAVAVDAVLADLSETFFPLAADGSVGAPTAIEERGLASAPGVLYSATPTQNPQRPDEYRVDVHLWWQGGGVRRGETFTTILLREVSFGERMRRRFVEGSRSEKDN
jgi:type II secretory pathway component PulJ